MGKSKKKLGKCQSLLVSPLMYQVQDKLMEQHRWNEAYDKLNELEELCGNRGSFYRVADVRKRAKAIVDAVPQAPSYLNYNADITCPNVTMNYYVEVAKGMLEGYTVFVSYDGIEVQTNHRFTSEKREKQVIKQVKRFLKRKVV